MGYYQVAINSISLAARILGIETPEMQLYNDHFFTKNGINSIFIKEKYVIVFSEKWIEQANYIEIQATCFHETRHAYQWKCIKGEISGKHNVDPITLNIWKKEMRNYYQPTNSDIADEIYLKQEIEIDAIAFAHYQMKTLFNIKSFIPEIIAKDVHEVINNRIFGYYT